MCKKGTTPGACQCYPCLIAVPTDVGGVSWASKNVIVWRWMPCAGWYNVYKITTPFLSDSDQNGVADTYGSCSQPDVSENTAPDSMDPPAGSASFYMVTGESTVGEGTMGWASNNEERPNTQSCP